MKKLLATALLMTCPLTFTRPSLVQRTYHVGAGTASGALLVAAALAGYDCATCCKKQITDDGISIPLPILGACYGSLLSLGALGTYRVGSYMISSFKKAFGSHSLMSVNRDNYTTHVINADKPCILAVLPHNAELAASVESSLGAVQELHSETYTFGTLTLNEATEILGVDTPSILMINDGNLVRKTPGIFNTPQLIELINASIRDLSTH